MSKYYSKLTNEGAFVKTGSLILGIELVLEALVKDGKGFGYTYTLTGVKSW